MKISKGQVGSIIRRIEVLIAENGMSKKEFYEKSGISSALFSQWNTGLYIPTEKSLAKAANTLGCTVDFLVNGGSTEKKEKPTQEGEPKKQELLNLVETMDMQDLLNLMQKVTECIQKRGAEDET